MLWGIWDISFGSIAAAVSTWNSSRKNTFFPSYTQLNACGQPQVVGFLCGNSKNHPRETIQAQITNTFFSYFRSKQPSATVEMSLFRAIFFCQCGSRTGPDNSLSWCCTIIVCSCSHLWNTHTSKMLSMFICVLSGRCV